jgi:hypothetical protein
VTIDLDLVCTKSDFEVIEIVDGTTPYPTFLGLDWEFDNHAIINLKTELGDIRVRIIQSCCTTRSIIRREVCRTHLFRLREI